MAISGLHLSMLGMGLYRLLQKIGCHKAVSSVLAVAMMALYTIFTGNGVATRRAFLMFTIMVIGGLIGRTYDSLSALALAAVITLIGQPEIFLTAGLSCPMLRFSAQRWCGLCGKKAEEQERLWKGRAFSVQRRGIQAYPENLQEKRKDSIRMKKQTGRRRGGFGKRKKQCSNSGQD